MGRSLIIVAGFLAFSACRSIGPTASPDATSLAQPTNPSAGTPSATTVPTSTPTPLPASTPTMVYDEALRQPYEEDDDAFPDATRYDLELTLDVEEATVLGQGRIRYTNTEDVPLDTLYLRLFPNTPGYGGTMTVTNLTLNGQLIEPATELDGSALRIPLEPALAPDAQVDLALDFSLALPTDQLLGDSRRDGGGYRQLGYFEDTIALANAYPIVPVYDDEGWNVELAPTYGDAVFSDVAFFDVTIVAPRTMTLAASGTCSSSPVSAEQAAWSCVAAPMRDFTAVLGEDFAVESREVEGTTVNSVFYAEHQEGGERALDYASDALALVNARIGPYPFTELDVVETPTLAGGIEYPGLVVINSSYYRNGGSRMEWVVVHEVLHQWWYALVGNDQVDEPWLDEALTQYCTLLYFEEEYGDEVAERLRETAFEEPYAQLQEAGRDRPVGLPVGAYNSSDYGAVVYQKGPLYFHALRQEVGEDAFWEILQTYFEENRYGIARPEDWLTAVETVTDNEYRDLYEAWIGDE